MPYNHQQRFLGVFFALATSTSSGVSETTKFGSSSTEGLERVILVGESYTKLTIFKGGSFPLRYE